MKLIRNLSVKNKLVGIIVVITTSTLAAAFAIVITKDISSFKEDMAGNTTAIARIVGDYSVIDLAFRDQDASQKTLKKLNAISNIESAFLYDENGKFFSGYRRSGETFMPPIVQLPSNRFEGSHLHLFEAIEDEGRQYGTIYLRANTEPLEARIKQYLIMMISLMLVLILLSFLLAVKLQALISEPILELADAARKISEKGDYSLRVKKRGEDEVGTLYEGFNTMLTQIEKRQREREEQQEQLKQYAKELERSNQELDQFAYVTSHDLKAPLQAIANLSEWIEEDAGQLLTGETKRHLELLRGRVNRMAALIQGILEYSRVRRVHEKVETVDVGKMLNEVVDLLDVPRGFTIDVQQAMPVISTAKIRLEQVFSNLIGNAIKHHNNREGRISIQARDEGTFYEFQVSDDGPGIAPEYHEKIFVIFQTLKARDHFESTGVGLALVKKIVEDNGGKITVDSSEGRGATFRFTWPKHPLQDVQMEVIHEEQQV